jgi:hypothetical protein
MDKIDEIAHRPDHGCCAAGGVGTPTRVRPSSHTSGICLGERPAQSSCVPIDLQCRYAANTWQPRDSSGGWTASPRTSFPNAGATRPAETWLDGLSQDGRLILPLTTNRGFIRNDPPVSIERRGAVFRIERRSSEFLARWISPIAIFPCKGARDPLSEAALAEEFEKGGWKEVTGLCRGNDVPEDRCSLRAPGWCLTRDLPRSSRTLQALVPGPPRE